MTPDELRAAIAFLEHRVELAESARPTTIAFATPSADDLVGIGLAENDARRLLEAAWWPEMVAEIIDTPSFCGAGEPPGTVLRYARDVVGEYVRKRFSPVP